MFRNHAFVDKPFFLKQAMFSSSPHTMHDYVLEVVEFAGNQKSEVRKSFVPVHFPLKQSRRIREIHVQWLKV